MIDWQLPTPAQLKASRLAAGFERIDDAAAAFGVSRRAWTSWEEPRHKPTARQMSPQNWLLWRILTGEITPPPTPPASARRKGARRRNPA